MKIPFLDLAAHHKPFAAAFRKKFDELLKNSEFILGAELEAFEREFAAYLGVKHAVGVSNGTDALRLAFEASGLRPGEEVIVPAYTFAATAFGVTFAGGVPKFVDVREDTFNLDPAKIEAAITPQTRAILPVHLAGQTADMDEILEIARRRNLRVIEDAAQAHGATYKGKKAGAIGDFGCFSFYPTKNLSALGDGGMVTTNSDASAERLRMLRNLGQKKRYVHDFPGHNNRLDNLQAAFLRIKLKKLDANNKKRRQAAERYSKELKGIEAVLPAAAEGCGHVWHLYSILHPRRDAVREALQAAGVACGVYYSMPLPYQDCYRTLGYRKGDFPVAEKISERTLSLPIFPEITPEQVRAVAKVVRESGSP